MVICQVCKDEFKSNQMLIKHVRNQHNYTAVEYRYYVTGEFSKCCTCSKELTLEHVQQTFRPGKKVIHCSPACSRVAKVQSVEYFKLKYKISEEEAKIKFSELQEHRKFISPTDKRYWVAKGYSEEQAVEQIKLHNKTVAGVSLDSFQHRYGKEDGYAKYAEFCLQRSILYSGMGNPRYGAVLTDETKNLISQGVKNFINTEDGRIKYFQKYLKSELDVNVSDLEFVVKEKLEELGIKCSAQYPIFIDIEYADLDPCVNKVAYLYDLKIDQMDVLIEVYGSYIHANPKIYTKDTILTYRGGSFSAEYRWKKDKYKEQYAEIKGFKLFIYWDDMNLNFFCQSIKSFLEN